MKNLIIYIVLFFSSIGVFAQSDSTKAFRDSSKKVKIEELKKARKALFIQKLGLTQAEAEKFFPIFDEYQLKRREAKKEFRNNWKGKKPADLTEEEASRYLADAIKAREREVELFKTYTEKLKTVLPAKKIVILPQVEREVQHELMSKAREQRGPKGPKPRNRKGPRPGK